MSEEKKVDMNFIEDIDVEINEKVLLEKEVKTLKTEVETTSKENESLKNEVDSLKKKVKKLECELDKQKDKLYCFAPPLPTDLWERSKNVWGSALHSYLSGESMDPGPLAIIERALFDAEKNGPSRRKDPNKVHCNGNCSCSSNKESKDETKKKRRPTKKSKTKNRKEK